MHTSPSPPSLTIRIATEHDGRVLSDLAQLDSAGPLAGCVLLAEVDGHPRAAFSLDDGSAISDPFFPSTDLLVLLRARAAALLGPPAPRRPWSRLARPSRASAQGSTHDAAAPAA